MYGDGPKIWSGWSGFEKTDTYYYTDEERQHIRMGPHLFQVSKVRLLLRPLSDMTEEERCEVSTLVPPDESPYWVKNIAEVTKWYLDRGFDLFGLIEAGLAIDKTDRN